MEHLDDFKLDIFKSDTWQHGVPKKITWANTAEEISSPTSDCSTVLLLPKDFAEYANELLMEARGLEDPPLIFVPVPRSDEEKDEEDEDEKFETEGRYELYVWRVSSTMMWQQHDRRIDE